MAHKTFISYKYSEAQDLRDDIIEALGEDASYYTGETSESPDLTDESTDKIKNALKDMMFGTTVTIVIISPNIKDSKWIDWEIEYCVKNITRKERTSSTNGLIGVIMKYNGDYSWFINNFKNADGHSTISYNDHLVYDIINKNRFNQNPKKYACEKCKSIDQLTGSYISYVKEEDFLNNITKYIDNAFDKSENENEYILCRQK